MTRKKAIDLLHSVSLFQTLDEGELEKIVGFIQEIDFKSRDVIVQQGKPSGGMFIIATPKARAKVIAQLFGDKKIELATLKTNDFFGVNTSKKS